MVNPRELCLQTEENLEQLKRHEKVSRKEKLNDATKSIQDFWRQRYHGETPVAEEKRDWVLLPILIIPGIASSGLVIEQSSLPNAKRFEGQRVWMNAAMLATSRMSRTVVNKAEIQQAIWEQKQRLQEAFEEVFHEAENVCEIRSAWLHHMSLGPDMVQERPGNRVRPYSGLEGAEYLSDDPMTQMGSWVHAPVTEFLVGKMGYTKGKNLDAAPYDWRLPPMATEARDGYLTATMNRIELMYHVNDELPVVLIGHSMGSKMCHYFLNFCLQKKGREWIDKYIHTYMPVGAPHGGVSLAVRAGVTGKGLNDQVDMLLEGDDEGLVLYRSWGSGAWLMPRQLPSHIVPSVIVRREGELGVKVASVLQVGPLFAMREKLPKELRLTIIFRRTVRAHTDFVPVKIHTTNHQPGQPLDATVDFDETFYIAVPYMEGYDHLGELKFYLEEPLGWFYQNNGELRKKFKDATSFGPIRAIKKKATKMLRETAKSVGTAVRVAVCEEPWHLQSSHFHAQSQSHRPELESFLSMYGCIGKTDAKNKSNAVYYREDLDESHQLDVSDKNSVNCQEEFQPHMEHPCGKLHVKLRYQPPPEPYLDTGSVVPTPVAQTKPGLTPKIPIRCKHSGNTQKVHFDVWDGHDLLKQDGFCEPIWELLQEYYENDPLGPTGKSALEAPPVKRIRSIYGINLPTEVCAVYRHRPVVVVGDAMADSRYVLDTDSRFASDWDESVRLNDWARQNLCDYKMDKGRIFETPGTLQHVPGKKQQRRCCGDGTVPYWNLIHCLSWKASVPDLTIDELDKAEHRGILADARFHALLKCYCKVRDPRAHAMLELNRLHRRHEDEAKHRGYGGIGALKGALRDANGN